MSRPLVSLSRTAMLAWVLIGLSAVAGCGSRAEALDRTANHHGASDTKPFDEAGTDGPASEAANGKASTVPSGRSPNGASAADGDGVAEADDDGRDEPRSADTVDPTIALSKKPTINPLDVDELLPRCAAPLDAEFGYPTYGTEAVRLHWKPETGECKFTSGDGTPAGWSGILTLRHHGDDIFLSGIGRWRYLAPFDLDLDDLPEARTLTFYPYLDDWQFVIDVRYAGQTVTIERFEYIDGEPPKDYGVPDRTSNEARNAGSTLVECGSLHGSDSEQADGQGAESAQANRRSAESEVLP